MGHVSCILIHDLASPGHLTWLGFQSGGFGDFWILLSFMFRLFYWQHVVMPKDLEYFTFVDFISMIYFWSHLSYYIHFIYIGEPNMEIKPTF